MHIVLTGPESTGKTTLVEKIKDTVDCVIVSEYAREYLRSNGLEYNRQDLRSIAFGQFSAQLSAMNSGSDLIISDTCLLTIEIWEDWKYGTEDPYIQEWKGLQQIDHYLLCKNDLDWEEDPMRENQKDLHKLFEMYQSRILKSGIPYSIISGKNNERFERAIEVVERLKKEVQNI